LQKRNIILAAGGTGGHVFPAQALAESLVERGWTVFLVTDHRGNAFTNTFPVEVQKLVLNMTNPRKEGLRNFILSSWLLIRSVIITLKFCLKVKVTIVVGFGGYPSVASMLVARLLRVPTVIHEQNAILGTVNKIFQNQVNLLVFGINPKMSFSRKGPTKILGNPIRQSVLNTTPKKYSKLPSNSIFILVVGGSQGANFVSSVACE
tara:strand:+ start:558 stop:1175 length:618 start_codon:yes stop_codon:yes gene_type:complete